MSSNFINKSISFFINKKKLSIILFSIIILFIVGFIYSTYATNTGVALGNEDNTYDILLTDSNNTVEVPAKSSKTVYYQFSNTNKGTIKYHIGYTSDNVIAKVWWDTEDRISGTIEYGEYKFIKLKLINESTVDDTITIKPVLGFKDGGDLVVPSDTTLVTNTINEVNTMSLMPTNALTTLGIDKANIKELSFVNDNIPSSDSLGSTNMNDDGSVKLWYTNSDTSGLYNVYIGSDNGISSFPVDCNALFRDFTALKTIDLKYIDTSNVMHMDNMFRNCSKIEAIDLENFITKNVLGMFAMFFQCESIKELDLKSFDTSNVTNMNSMFNDCSSLESLDLSNFNTSSVKFMAAMFNDCTNLTFLDVSGFDTSSVTNMNSMFGNCISLANINILNFDTSNVEDMAWMFNNCKNINEINLSNFNTGKLKDASYMFYKCINLTSIDLSSFNTENVINMAGMFQECINLTSVNVLSFDTFKVENLEKMFSGCSSLTSVDLSNFNTPNVTNVSNMFINCSSLTNIDMRNVDLSSVISLDNMLYSVPNNATIYLKDTQGNRDFINNNFSSYTNVQYIPSS